MEVPDPRIVSQRAVRPAALVAGLYTAASALWILVSDRLVEAMFAASGAVLLAQTLKGWAFVAVTGGLIFYGCYRLNRSLLTTESFERLAHYDAATGLPNKLLFLPLVENCLQQAARSRAVVGAEALVRWYDAELGEVEPAVFIPLAEESGLIGRITRLVLRRTVAMLATLNAGAARPVRIAVNVSGREIAAGQVDRLIRELTREQDVSAEHLEIELTETAAMDDPELTALALQALRGIGVRVALDDFATGYSSLAQLHQFRLDKIKIDRGFVSNLPKDAKNLGICKAVIAMAHTLGLDVVAEGVETEAAARTLTELGCHLAQGHFFYRPLREADFERLLCTGAQGRAADESNVAVFPRRGTEG
jgi:EAL domain-containing protein (putative c-di-GMP-specific phosphodiesterase class I)